ncbi:MAG: rhomboid family intramembrane serine protease [Opitutaceae bacterium]|nr:rhomboid family intramembrane serine protease [Verrucomicrobiales bacterium]
MARQQKPGFGAAVETAAAFVFALVLVKATEIGLGISLAGFGIRPRQTDGLAGIVFSPLLHASIAHLTSNALPLLVLMTLLFWDRRYRPVSTLVTIWLASGVGTWLIGRGDSIHIGASSLIYGLVAFLIASGLKLKSLRAVLVAVVVFLAYGGAVYGILPENKQISWEGHLCGAIAGILTARTGGNRS